MNKHLNRLIRHDLSDSKGAYYMDGIMKDTYAVLLQSVWTMGRVFFSITSNSDKSGIPNWKSRVLA